MSDIGLQEAGSTKIDPRAKIKTYHLLEILNDKNKLSNKAFLILNVHEKTTGYIEFIGAEIERPQDQESLNKLKSNIVQTIDSIDKSLFVQKLVPMNRIFELTSLTYKQK